MNTFSFMLRNNQNPVLFVFVSVLVLITIISCVHSSGSSNKLPDSMPESFLLFYHQFHTDSIYQMEHITFPLEGIPGEQDSVENALHFRWPAETWALHHKIDNSDSAYVRTFRQFENVVVEKIKLKGTPFQMERRFAELVDGWNLIYYATMRAR